MDSKISIVGKADKPAVLHHLPCTISHDGPARVNMYFVPETTPEGKLYSYFRGRKIEGHVVDLPAGVTGLVVKEIAGKITSNVDTPAEPSTAETQSLQPGETVSGLSSRSTASNKAGSKPSGSYANRRSGTSFTANKGGYGGRGDSSSEDDSEDADVGFDFASEGDDSEVELVAPVVAVSDVTPVKRSAPTEDAVHMRQWEIEGSFKSATYWLHDKPISEVDPLRAAADWIEIARALHGVGAS